VVNQHIVEDGSKRSLKEFADAALEYLKDHLEENEVVQLASNILELENNALTAPRVIYPLPDGFEYNFSGFYGLVIGVGRARGR